MHKHYEPKCILKTKTQEFIQTTSSSYSDLKGMKFPSNQRFKISNQHKWFHTCHKWYPHLYEHSQRALKILSKLWENDLICSIYSLGYNLLQND